MGSDRSYVGFRGRACRYLNANTWGGDWLGQMADVAWDAFARVTALGTQSKDTLLASDINKAQKLGIHLQLSHEFPSVLDPGSTRAALEFKDIMEATPAHLKSGDRNMYKKIAVSLKGGEWRRVGLTALAATMAANVERYRHHRDQDTAPRP